MGELDQIPSGSKHLESISNTPARFNQVEAPLNEIVVGYVPVSPGHPVDACMTAKEIVSTNFPPMPVAIHEQSGLKRKVYRNHTISTISAEIARGFPI